MSSPQIILASTSPRRRELLTLLGLRFEVVAPTCEEVPVIGLSPNRQAKQFACDKACSVSKKHPQHLVLGSDTIIEIEGMLLGKPKDIEEAEAMLKQLRGRTHHVRTGVALVKESDHLLISFAETATVRVRNFTDGELTHYLSTKESLGKAGAYSIQGKGKKLIEKIEGDYPTIVGLPLWRVAKLLEQQGMRVPNSAEEIYRVKPYANWKEFS
ncbi:MAG: Maf family protein [Nitrospirales bacterium]|nr:septum formation protein Maf [Nitrospira sp.]MDR4500806.1 Maf family protein [Nitrospirales bacterium]